MNWLKRFIGGADAQREHELRLSAIRLAGQHAPLFQGLTEDEWQRLAKLADAFLAGKNWLPQEDLTLDERSAYLLALQACLPVLNLPEDTLSGWRDLVVYPSAFVARDQWHDEIGLVHEGRQILIGQARQEGPVLLSLPDALASLGLDGWNVVIHEIAHKLDMLNGDANGYPPLHKGMQREQWARDWGQAFEVFNRYLDNGVRGDTWSWLDPYAAEAPAEFFAVLSECFFEAPHWVQHRLPALYQHLSDFYRQDPASRLPDIPLRVLTE